MRRMERDRSIRLRSEETVPEPGRHVPPPHPSPNSCQGHRARIITRSGYTKEAARQTPLVFVGIDVSKARLDVGVRPSDERISVPYDAHGITTLIAQLTQVQPTRIIMEATGGLERLLLRAGGRCLARDRGKSAPGPGLCQGNGAVGQDGHARCVGVGALWGGHPAASAGDPRCPDPGVGGPAGAAPPSAGDAGGRAASPGSRPGSGSETDRGPSALVARRTGAAGCGPG